jgi:hypothetical protein
MPNSEYIIHGTNTVNLLDILKEGYIDNTPPKKNIMMLTDNSSNQIFTQLIYKDIPNEKIERPIWFNCAIILDNQILKDYPFYATPIGGFTEKFENGKNNEETLVYGEGNLSTMPNLTKLKNWISKRLLIKNVFKGLNFIYSHEILFNKKIPLDKYCKCIIVFGANTSLKDKKNLLYLAKKLNIPLKIYSDKKRQFNGLNNFINMIEKNIKNKK